MVEIVETNVITSEDRGEQVLEVQADINSEVPESYFYLRRLGSNTWFTFIGCGRANQPVDSSGETRSMINEVEEELVN